MSVPRSRMQRVSAIHSFSFGCSGLHGSGHLVQPFPGLAPHPFAREPGRCVQETSQ
jgi:hypothetical protein